jgi:hypothetical protein
MGQLGTNQVELWTFAGTRMNRLIAAQLDPSGEKSSFNHRSVLLKGSYKAEDVEKIWSLSCDRIESGVRIIATEEQANAVKFSDAVPLSLRKLSIEYRLDPQARTIGHKMNLTTIQ